MKSHAKFTLSVLFFAAILAGVVLSVTSCSKQESAQGEQLYTCGMHPQVIQNKPGNCPICGMKLTPIRKQPRATAAAHSGERKIKYYKSTMNPGEIKPGPGKDSMGMDMVPVYEGEADAAEASVIQVDPATVQNMGLRTGVVTRGPLRRNIRTVGII